MIGMSQPSLENHRNTRWRLLLLSNVYTLWLFTKSDLTTIVLPQLVLAFSNARCTSFVHPAGPRIGMQELIGKLPLAVTWIWAHLLVQTIANQRLPESILKDEINKPWRPLASKLISRENADALLFAAIPICLIFSRYLGETQFSASAFLCAFSWLYNDLNGANLGVVIRNALNACALLTFSIGATAIALDGAAFSGKGYAWFVTLWLIIFTTVHTQDLADFEGDAAQGPKAAPLLSTDATVRYSIGLLTLGWSMFCIFFWIQQLSYIGCAVLALASVLTFHVVCWRSAQADRDAWVVWCMWLTLIFMLPNTAS